MLIIDKEMPKNCYDCPCFDIEWSNCNLTKSYVFSHDKDRAENCPLKEVSEDRVEQFWITVQNNGV